MTQAADPLSTTVTFTVGDLASLSLVVSKLSLRSRSNPFLDWLDFDPSSSHQKAPSQEVGPKGP